MSEPFDVVQAGRLPDTPPSQRWLIEELWSSNSVGVVAGQPKACKSWLGLEMAVSVATATPCLGRFAVPRPGPCLVYLAEDSPAMVRERLAALCAHRGIDINRLEVSIICAPALKLDNRLHVERLNATLKAHKPLMLLLDPLVRLHNRDENSSTEISPVLDTLRVLQRAHEVCIVLVHHVRKVGASRAGQGLRGSSDIWAWGDSNIFISHQNGRLKLTIEHRAAPAPHPVAFQLASDPPHLALAQDGDPPPTLRQRIIEELARSSLPLNRTELRKRLAVRNKHLGDTIEELLASNILERTAGGLCLTQRAGPP